MRKLAILTAALLAALAAGVLAVSAGSGSSHREAPLTSIDPTGDDTDVYAFVAPDAPGSLTLIANWIPFEDPAGGPNFYRFDDRASYYLNVDNTGDGKYDVRYRFKFKTKVRNPNSFLYALPGVKSIDDPKLNLVQTYSVWRERYEHGHLVSNKIVASGLPTAPNNVGPEDVPQLRRGRRPGDQVAGGRRQGVRRPGRRPVLRRPRLDVRRDQHHMPGRAGIGTGNQGGGKDDVAGYNVHSIALQVPKADVTRDHKTPADANASNAVVGVWASTYRPRLQVTVRARSRARRAPAPRSPPRGRRRPRATGARSRSAAWATRWSTRSSSRLARRTASTRPSPPTT